MGETACKHDYTERKHEIIESQDGASRHGRAIAGNAHAGELPLPSKRWNNSLSLTRSGRVTKVSSFRHGWQYRKMSFSLIRRVTTAISHDGRIGRMKTGIVKYFTIFRPRRRSPPRCERQSHRSSTSYHRFFYFDWRFSRQEKRTLRLGIFADDWHTIE